MPLPLLVPVALTAAEYAASALAGILVGVGVGLGVEEMTKEDEKEESLAQTDEISTAREECKVCPATEKVSSSWESTSSYSQITLDYQLQIAKTIYKPDAKLIQVWECLGVSFDGWRPEWCLFLESKAKYDQFFRKGKPVIWWTGDESMKKQGRRQQDVCASLSDIPRSHWHFMEPVSAAYYSQEFAEYFNIKVFHTPLLR
ncbi:restriction endonuclease fold toxin 5 domain-containing protein [Photorhabdus luminescens]|uniref:restriction endonuclease fold toxin 5 domain-containing protein n=1 Tax=Photorhabdus luminescens TaxID=29488 RepID=UPI00223F2715|nr:restriction endonuclease fold toxin 5 domain-containing protein [Photorhabdus luminescens]MCW7762354.1 restriction endonuclease fold toxin 5 domain-containing protein [Photorhabdus luminescens subsp. venezuelensis]